MEKFFYTLFITILLFTTGCGSNSINQPQNGSTLYEDAEDGSVDRWVVTRGFPVSNVNIGKDSKRSILVKQNWLKDENGEFIKNENGFVINDAEYDLAMYNDHQFILEFDKMKEPNEEIHYCFTVGTKVDTLYGERLISFNTYYDRIDLPPAKIDADNGAKELVFPLSMKYVVDAGVWKHIRLDLNEYLHKLEPNNQITLVKTFYFEGGDDYLDNIMLSSE